MNKIDDSFFQHSSVAIAGASSEYNIGHAFVQCMQDSGFEGKVYPLNPARRRDPGAQGLSKNHDVPGKVDYVISCIPARFTAQLVKDSAAKGAKIVSFFTAGYSETGREEGRGSGRRTAAGGTGRGRQASRTQLPRAVLSPDRSLVCQRFP